ncbi:helix-turn-helix domain-containing protein [Companilactobacillus sp. DQM5]|uniref:helix-turn-helix domain-containing protein n=1 Tax=Companilactobacillus sp. DQM5 TaxID=3463359 RepID=UPI004057EDA3
MDSKLDELLENDDRYKLFIYQILQIRKEGGISTGELKKIVELSDFKFNQLLKELKSDLYFLKSKIIIIDKMIDSSTFTSKDYQALRLSYFKKSIAADFLIKVGLLESFSLNEFADLHYMSSSSIYRLQKEVNNFLSEYGLSLKSATVTGEEKNIRSFYFQLFFSYYGGMQSPFSDRIDTIISDNLKIIRQNISVSISQNQNTQLNIFLGIQIYRISNNHFIKNKIYTNFDSEKFPNIFKSSFSLRKIPKNEIEYLHLYLMLNQNISFNNNLQLKTTALEKSFIEFLNQKLSIMDLKVYDNIVHEIHIIAQRWFNFQLTTTSFISMEQLEFFQQSYPLLHNLVNDFIMNLKKIDNHKISKLERTYLYYEFIFCLLSFQEIKNFESQIKIYVDFSSGKHYNQYISENIENFKYLNIQVTKEFNEDTDIYISDFSSSQVSCLQIIWKAPPLDSDWEEFANAVVDLKGQRNE